MSDDVLDLSAGRTVKGASGAEYRCRRLTNDVSVRYRAAERAADATIRKLERQQDRAERAEDWETWEQLDREVLDARLGVLVPILQDPDGGDVSVDTLRDEFTASEIEIVVAHAARPTLPGWLTTRSRENA